MKTINDEAFPAAHRRRNAAPAPRKVQLARHVSRAFSWAACSLALVALPKLAAAQEVSLVIESPPSPLLPGQAAVYHLRVTNRSTSAPTGALVLEANIPQYMAVTRDSWGKCSPKSCLNGASRYGNIVRWSLPSLAPGESTAQAFRATIDNSADYPPPTTGTELVLDAIVKSGTTKAAEASTRVVARALPPSFDLSATGTPRALPGEELEYTFRYGNRSSAKASGVLRVPLPKGTRVLLASKGAVQRGSAVEWETGSLAAGHSDFRTLRLALESKATVGTFVSVEPELQAGTVTSRASTSTHVGPESPLKLTMTAAPDAAAPGGTVVYKLDVTNQSPNAPSGAFQVLASIPRHVTVTRPVGAKCAPSSCLNGKVAHGNFVVWNVKSLPPGATTPLQFAAVVDKPAAAAPPPNGSVLGVQARTSLGDARASIDVVLGTPGSVGKGTPLVPLGAAPPKPVAEVKPAPAPPPPPTPAAIPVAVVEPEPEPAVEEIPDEEVVAELPPADDENKVSAVEVKQRTKWKALDWDKYCAKRWQAHAWDRHCAKRWWKQKDWNKFCKAEGKKHRGWKKYCARDFKRWKFAKRSKWSKRKHSAQGKQARPHRKQ